ncbi:putative RNA-binding Zn ribbon-like protein [Catenulispora sp. EB89]|uniref:CGNR zinc finger domain-containing protein n=1 Tax=Catenulispora sp. EB89 TaxID=3156257 RepID=UPI003512CBFD
MSEAFVTQTRSGVRVGGEVTTKDLRRAGFPFRSGRICLDFVATVAKRRLGDRELLPGPDELRTWCRVAGLPEPEDEITPDLLGGAHALREALYRLARARVDGTTHPAADIETVNAAAVAAAAPPTALLGADGFTAVPCDGSSLAGILALIARDAIDLLTGPYALRIRECTAHDCSLFFVDRSRPGSRRWCTMASCGEKASSAKYRQRHPGYH